MRYNELKSVILEYKREPTARSFGPKIIGRIAKSPASVLDSDLLYTAQTIVNLAMNPQNFTHWGIGRKKMEFNGQWISVGVDNAKEVLQQIQPVIINAVLEMLEKGDPTQNKVFVPWLAREWSNGNIKRFEDIDSRLSPLMKDFIAYKNKKDFPQEAKDIMRLTATQFEEIMSNYQPPADQQRARGQAEQVYDGSTARVIVPEDEEAACYYGQGTKWCTAATRGNNMFNHYARSGKLYVIIPKNPEYEGEKYQLHFYSEQFMNEQDDPVELLWIFRERFPELKELFMNLEPQMKSFLAFADDEVVEGLGKVLGVYIMDHVWEVISEWEHNDDYYYKEQREAAQKYGFWDEENEQIDFDKIEEIERQSKHNLAWVQDYTEFNDEAHRFLQDMRSLENLSAAQIRDYASDYADDDAEGNASLTDLPDIYSEIVTDANDNGEYIAKLLRQHVWLRPGDEEQWAKAGDQYIYGSAGGYTVGRVKSRKANESRSGISKVVSEMDRRGFLRGVLGAGAIAAGINSTDAEAAQKKKDALSTKREPQIQPPKKITPEESRAGHSPQELKAYVEAMAQKYLPPNQVAQFVGQVAHETANFTSMIEQNPEKNIKHYAKPGNPLGNKSLQDAWKYIGRGFLQITGKYNYKHFGDKIRPGLGDELLANPNLAMRKDYAIALAVMFWRERVAPKMDSGASQHEINKSINGKKPKGSASRDKFVRQASNSQPRRV